MAESKHGRQGRMIMQCDAGGYTHPGKRPGNQDAFLINSDLGLFVIADGVGGEDRGEVASELTCQIINQRLLAGGSLGEGIEAAHDAVRQASLTMQNSMATTVVAALCHARPNGLQVELAWVGDSRAYLVSSQSLCLLSEDHSQVRLGYQQGQIEFEALVDHPKRHVLYQAIGMSGEGPVPSFNAGCLNSGEMLMLCTDGVSDTLRGEEILHAFEQSDSAGAMARKLVLMALQGGAKDNCSCLCVRLPGGPQASKRDWVSGWLNRYECFNPETQRFEPLPKDGRLTAEGLRLDATDILSGSATGAPGQASQERRWPLVTWVMLPLLLALAVCCYRWLSS